MASEDIHALFFASESVVTHLHSNKSSLDSRSGQVALNDPAQNPHLGNALNDPTPGKRVHSMTPSLKKISPRHKKN